MAGTSMGEFEPEDGLIGVPWGAVIKVMKDGTTERPPTLGEECRAGEAGFVWLNTPAMMKGYFGRDDLTRQVVSQGWFTTGDIGAVDERGWLYLRGRERDEKSGAAHRGHGNRTFHREGAKTQSGSLRVSAPRR